MNDEVTVIQPTDYQARVLSIPEDTDICLAGGRGGGKTFAELLLSVRHVEQYGKNARVLIVRKNFPDLRDFETEARHLFTSAYDKVSFNAQTHMFKFPNGATVAFDQIESVADFSKFQGKSFSLIIVDEAGQFPDPAPLDLLRSCLRSKAGIPCRFILAANPGGAGHAWLFARHVVGQTPFVPYTEPATGARFVTAPSTLEDNPHLDTRYARQIEAATATDEALRRAWLDGDWNIAKGAFFGSVFSDAHNVIDPWLEVPTRGKWRTWIAGDHGTAAPCVFYIMCESPGAEGPDGNWYPAGSVVLLDEIAFVESNSLNKGLGLTIPTMAIEVVEQCKQWGVRPAGCMDDACFSNHGSNSGSLADEYRRAGLILHRAGKGDRASRWERMRRMMQAAKEREEPALFVSRRCRYWLETVPYLDRHPQRPEDVDTRGPDHGADAAAYGIFYKPATVKVRKTKGF
ncbi:Terminase-like family protein [Oceanococcus atlanticus]|uniref:Terminase-like family protein n=1 Tax=Oceanococcus atlanticus TaxID=1317117 RepID=A0A1Y1SBL3_9GAMM|nr:phage terminase large subunit [Oceanococcus atlanticus]ORE86040.1 Terminase-like family protein [Oceanococcus atlanticus]